MSMLRLAPLLLLFGCGEQLVRETSFGLGTWRSLTPLPAVRWFPTALAAHGKLYVLGGGDGTFTRVYGDVLVATIAGDGSLGSWTTSATFTPARERHATVVHNGFIYVVGGSSGPALDDVSFAALNADGSVGAFAATTPLPSPRYEHASVIVNDFIYVIGGFETADLADVSFAPVGADGTIGAWRAAAPLPVARYGHTALVHGGHIYVVAGFNSGPGYFAEVLTATPRADGTLSGWTAIGSVPVARERHATVLSGDDLYLVGGYGQQGELNAVDVGRFDATGSLGPWTSLTPFPVAREAHASVIANDTLYVIGGYGRGVRDDVVAAPMGVNRPDAGMSDASPITEAGPADSADAGSASDATSTGDDAENGDAPMSFDADELVDATTSEDASDASTFADAADAGIAPPDAFAADAFAADAFASDAFAADAFAADARAPGPDPRRGDGCDCRTSGGPSASGTWFIALALVLQAARRRGRRL
ncbi:MAG: hypothetical protein IT384_18405 [Deltaproteobacteria bacterium]|nr:hypothetical protein [Deltaproteobacteria bacterium]